MFAGSSLRSFYEMFGAPERAPRGRPNGGRPPKYVKFVGKDKGEGLPEVFLEDPHTFQPKPGPKGQIHAWGLYPYGEAGQQADNLPDYDGAAIMFRQMNYQLLYFADNPPSPERQFLKVLMERKRQQLEQVDLAGLDKRDVILRISLCCLTDAHGKPRVWRRFRVSAGTNLGVFQDKIISPIMGWVRNYHCYTFTDYRDGALFGPEKSGAIDRAHSAQVGYDFLPDDIYMLAHLFGKEGDQFGYLYDFGDKWYHDIEVEKIFDQKDSDGHVEILEGCGICPGGTWKMQGNFNWEDDLKMLDKGSPSAKRQKIREILSSPNYEDYKKSPATFDHNVFDKELAVARLNTALASPNSVKSGAKKFNQPIAPGAQDTIRMMDERWNKKGESVQQRPSDDSGGFWQETVTNARDKKRESVCAACGKPAGAALRACSACKKILYCSVECQKRHWKIIHKSQCVPRANTKDKGGAATTKGINSLD